MRREDVVLEGTFTAQVNAGLEVGALEESVTVTGATPTVDVTNNRTQFVANRDILDAIPTPIRNTPARALLLPGTTVTPFVLGQYSMSVHGSNTADMVIAIDGLRVNNLCGSGQYSGFYMNDASIQEVTFTTGAESAEMQNGGLRINSTPKDGGNRFTGTFFAYGAGSELQADNRSDEVKAAGIPQPSIAYTWQVNPSFGGPIKRDKLWFYFTYKYEDNKTYVASSAFADGSRGVPTGAGQLQRRHATDVAGLAARQDPLLCRPPVQRRGLQRLQYAPDHVTGSLHRRVRVGLGAADQVDADHHQQAVARGRTLLLHAGLRTELPRQRRTARPPTPGTDHRPADRGLRQHHSAVYQLDQELQLGGLGQLHHRIARVQGRRHHGLGHQLEDVRVERPDQHAGVQQRPPRCARQRHQSRAVHRVAVSARRRRDQRPRPAEQKVNNDLGFFVQDTWTIDKLTLNLGGRFDQFNAMRSRTVVAGQHVDPGAQFRRDQGRAQLE